MGSKKEEERNEKIIRGLMKLPPNRRCINCNSLGPQYVCINFWTFICMTCSGIHREFTHRVKSVSMSKFTSQEVEALQNGGNQRARDIYLRDWDQQRQRLPDNSNVEKVREFIKTVYVDKRYAGGKTHDKPPRDLQRLRSPEDETRRASSYHSYSQSPPYDFQYEDRRYGKQAAVLTRKPGSDRGLYVGKMSSFICSPTRLNERMFEDSFANEGSVSRVSDYSVSSRGDPFGRESPNFQTIQTPRDNSGQNGHHQRIDQFSEENFKRDADGFPRRQRPTSLGSVGSFDSNSESLKSYNSGNLPDAVSEPECANGDRQDRMPTFPQLLSTSESCGSLDHFKAPVFPESSASGSSPMDLFQLPAASPASSINLFQAPLDPASSLNAYQTTQTSVSSSIDLFGGIVQQQSVTSLNQNLPESSVPKNEGWATFDTQPMASTLGTGNLAPSMVPSNVDSSAKLDQVSSLDTGMQWPPFQNSTAQGSSSVPSPWHNDLHNLQASGNTGSAQTWNAFDNSITRLPLEGSNQVSQPQVTRLPSSTADQYLGLKASEDPSKYGIQGAALYEGLSGLNGPLDNVLEPTYTPSENPKMEAPQPYTINHKSTNPFDLPYDSDLEPGNMFLDMSSLQTALPNAHLPSTFLGGVTEPWFPQDPVATYIPAAPKGSLAYMAGQAPSPQLGNVQTQGPVASVGGNPFA
ncbi:hypothetical protein P3X46_008164 [Hevea brasiliensis]|uniref:Arf-GAP domain-containing protein n=1 Tax=Hevea brasiliensis TaxID=3981 RepID=A0ABQ9MKC5_HEVBR|nr:probable ADP-ribosylation factor GTPase-activating protein AGD14 isoform X1 [Hevea brasiliensis]KAJ9179848.1 hypothetical protein P3X46_008164 [Hevea brasiliensis]